MQKIQRPILVVGATGNTGRRVTARLEEQGVPVRRGSRASSPPFDWIDSTTWGPALEGVEAVYIAYPQELPLEGATEHIGRFIEQAREASVQRVVLLTGRGEEVGLEQEQRVKDSGLPWTVIRSAWFDQNFTEGSFAEMVQAGELVLPEGRAPEPFVDLEDLADVAVAALTLPGHAGQVYDVTGPRLLTFRDVASGLSLALGRTVTWVPVSLAEFLSGLAEAGATQDTVSLMEFLFGDLLDGRNARLGDGVQRALGREPRDFMAFAQRDLANGAEVTMASRNSHAGTKRYIDNTRTIQRFVTEFINGGDEEALDEIVHDDYVYRSPDEDIRGRDGLIGLFRAYRAAFPDLTLTIHDLLADRDKTILDFSLGGTHRGEFMGIPASGRTFRTRGVVISRFLDGRILEEWEILDLMTMFHQLGIHPDGAAAT